MQKVIYESKSTTVYRTSSDGMAVIDAHPESAVVLALHRDRVVVVRQYREPISGYTFELPGGGIEEYERPSDAARRELLEETGLTCGHLDYLVTTHSDGHLTNQVAHLFFTSDTILIGPQHLDEGEDIEVLFQPSIEVFQNISEGIWQNAEMAHALLVARLRGYL